MAENFKPDKNYKPIDPRSSMNHNRKHEGNYIKMHHNQIIQNHC